MAKNHYQVLGIHPKASLTEIRDAYLLRMKVVHPDRFDPNIQHDEWLQANEMLKELNEAYAVLKDDKLRHEYNKTLKPHNYENHDDDKQNTNHKRSSSTKLGKLISGKANFKDLPKSASIALLQRQNGEIKDQYQYKIAGKARALIGMSMMPLWCIYAIYNAALDKFRWEIETWFWYLLFSCVFLFIFTKSGSFINRWNASNLKCYIYATRLYIIKTWLDDVYYYPLWEIKNIKTTHNYRNGFHVSSDVNFIFNSGEETISFSKKKSAEDFIECINLFNRTIFEKKMNNDMRYFYQNDDFRDVEKDEFDLTNQNNYIKINMIKGGLLLAIALYLAFTFNSNKNNHLITKPLPPHTKKEYSNYSIPPTNTLQSVDTKGADKIEPSTQYNKPTQINAPTVPQKPFPNHGTIKKLTKNKNIAPLEIITNPIDTEYYYIKLVDFKSNTGVLNIYLHPGKSFKTDVPLGSYKIKYATGLTWYGEKHLFGSETKCSAALEQFDFVKEGNSVKGYTVELILQQHGNLRTVDIPIEDF
ncbi:MAG: J domain-containing protein [Thermodesulfobacteriota bacterium]